MQIVSFFFWKLLLKESLRVIGSKRFIFEESREENPNEENRPVMILAANKTHRRDPTNNFNYYTGGWDITNSHYIFVSF